MPTKHPVDFEEKVPESLQQVALAVPPIDDNFDPDAPPETGEQYLQQVIYERQRRVPEVVYNHRDRPADREDIKWIAIEGEGIESTAPLELLPTKEWCDMQCDTFRCLQKRIASIRETKNLPINLPPIPKGSCSSVWFPFCSSNQPQLKFMIQISQAQLEDLLHHFVQWRHEGKAELSGPWLMQWIYASLACLHQPLEPNIHYCLRQVARICIEARNCLESDCITEATPLNLIISIIAKIFGQGDLLQLW
uniref:Gem-associated protein 2 n=1 Tax=Lutzomyia longipalpis TaxID=7200 RepID=A0A1B0CKU3_LUTLO